MSSYTVTPLDGIVPLPWQTAPLQTRLNIRMEPTTKSPILRKTAVGEVLTLTELVVGEQAEARGTTAWLRVQGGGYVYGGVIGKVEAAG